MISVWEEVFINFNRAYKFAKKNWIDEVVETRAEYFDRTTGVKGKKVFVHEVK